MTIVDPTPKPEPFRKDAHVLVKYGYAYAVMIPGHSLTPKEADAMAEALVEHAAYAREQEEPEAKEPEAAGFSSSQRFPRPGTSDIDDEL